jgi:excisionase family DNA binding protein
MENFLTPAEAADVLRVCVRTVYLALRSGKLKGTKPFGGNWRISPADIRAFVESGVRPSGKAAAPAPAPQQQVSLKQLKGRPRR